MCVKKWKLELDLLSEFLPDSFLGHFNVVLHEKLGNVDTKKIEFELDLDEQEVILPYHMNQSILTLITYRGFSNSRKGFLLAKLYN